MIHLFNCIGNTIEKKVSIINYIENTIKNHIIICCKIRRKIAATSAIITIFATTNATSSSLCL